MLLFTSRKAELPQKMVYQNVGGLWLMASGDALYALLLEDVGRELFPQISLVEGGIIELKRAVAVGSPFQVEVWKELMCVGEGERCTYGDLAQRMGRCGAARAVGSALGSNPLSLLIPCHRVLASGGKMGGYRWGAREKTRALSAGAWRRLRRIPLLAPLVPCVGVESQRMQVTL